MQSAPRCRCSKSPLKSGPNSIRPYRTTRNVVDGVVFTFLDITDARRSECLEAALTLAVERERCKLAADLHDGAGQLLSLTSIKPHALGDSDKTQRGDQMIELESLLIESRRRVSSLSFQLSPPLLHYVNLVAALQWLKADLDATYGLDVTIIEEHELELEENVRVTWYRATHELLLR